VTLELHVDIGPVTVGVYRSVMAGFSDEYTLETIWNPGPGLTSPRVISIRPCGVSAVEMDCIRKTRTKKLNRSEVIEIRKHHCS